MDLAGRYRDGIAHANILRLAFDRHDSLTIGDVIDFFCLDVIVWNRLPTDWNAGLGETLIADGRISIRQQLSNFGGVLRGERRHNVEVFNIHG